MPKCPQRNVSGCERTDKREDCRSKIERAHELGYLVQVKGSAGNLAILAMLRALGHARLAKVGAFAVRRELNISTHAMSSRAIGIA